MSSENLPKMIAAGAVAAFLALGAWTLGHAGSGDDTASAAAQGPPGVTTGNGQGASGGALPQGGTLPQGTPPGMGTAVTGTTATKVAKAATARYPGRVERVTKLSDGSYVAHVFTSSGEVHVLVSRDFEVTGVEQGGPPQGFGPGQAPDGSSSGTTGTQT